jgi:hypothetical protein
MSLRIILSAAICCSLCLSSSPAFAGVMPPGALADYQLGGAYPLPQGVTMVVRDSTANPAKGYFNICYVNGFQTQPGVDWPKSLLVQGKKRGPMIDPNWPDEYLLDISTPKARAANLERLLPTIKACAEKGFDAVEFDNLDSYSRSERYLTLDHAVAFAKMLVGAARDMGLPAAQKNTTDLGSRGRDEIGFAFAISEACYRWDECSAYTDVYGRDQVIGIEYSDDLRGSFKDACADPSRPASMILRDRKLGPIGSPGYVF